MKKDEYGSDYNAHLLEQYKLYVQMADNVSSRRQSANSFFLTINTTIVALVGYINASIAEANSFNWLISVSGMLLSFLWYRLIRSYKDLNSGKFQVIHKLEEELPSSPYDLEWEQMGKGTNSKLYLPFTHIELFIPWVFFTIHAIVLSLCILKLFTCQ